MGRQTSEREFRIVNKKDRYTLRARETDDGWAIEVKFPSWVRWIELGATMPTLAEAVAWLGRDETPALVESVWREQTKDWPTRQS